MQALRHDSTPSRCRSPRANIDTDQIVPARYLQKPRSDDFGELPVPRRAPRRATAREPDFVLNAAAYRGAQHPRRRRATSAAARRASTRSGRSHDCGFRAVIAPSFGDIFRSNALKNGLLPVVLPDAVVDAHARGAAGARRRATCRSTWSRRQSPRPTAQRHRFDDRSVRQATACSKGIDELDYTLGQLDADRGLRARYARAEPLTQAETRSTDEDRSDARRRHRHPK